MWIGKPDPRYDEIYLNDSAYFTVGAGFTARPMDGSNSNPNFIENQRVIDTLCSDDFLREEGIGGCKVYRNTNGVTIARVYRHKEWVIPDGYQDRQRTYYYIYTGNRAYPGIAFTLSRPESAGEMDKVLETLRIVN